MKSIIALTTFILTTIHVVAQLTPADKQMNVQAVETGSVFRSYDNRYQGIKGGIFLSENFVRGKIYMGQGQVVAHEKINYDAYNDELVVVKNNQEMVVTATMVSGFVMEHNGDTLHFRRILRPDGKVGFYQQLNRSDGVILYKRHYKTLLQADYKGGYSAGRDYSEFVPEQKYLVQPRDAKPQEFRNKKSFLQLFPEQEKELETFIKSEKIDFKNAGDLVRLVDYLNTLKVS